jgi:hypothetical protein
MKTFHSLIADLWPASKLPAATPRIPSSNYPIVQLRSLETSEAVFPLANPVGGWSDTSFTSRPVRGFPSGPALVTVFTNGIPSTAKYLVVPKQHQ